MKAEARGFGLVEILLALTLGLVMSLALMQVFISSKSTYMSQTSSAAQQEEARFLLGKIVKEVRLVGMFGCLAQVDDASVGGGFSRAFDQPIRWDTQQQLLTLATAAIEQEKSWHSWVVHTDCTTSAKAYTRGQSPGLKDGELALPIHQQRYQFNARRSELSLNGQPMISNVRAFSVLFGVADSIEGQSVARYTAQSNPALIRSVRLTITLFDPDDRTREQTFNVVAAIRNRLG